MSEVRVKIAFREDERVDITFESVEFDELDALFDSLGTTEGRNQFADRLQEAVAKRNTTPREGERR